MDDLSFMIMQLHAKGYCCSQILFIAALAMQGRHNPDLVRAMSGLCHGIGFSRDVCGVVSGGACLLAMYTAKGADDEEPHDTYAGLMTEFMLWFRQHVDSPDGGVRCAEILSSHERSYCGTLIADAYAKVMGLLSDSGIDPLMPGGAGGEPSF